MSVKDIVGADYYEKLRTTLQRTFPDPGVQVPDDAIDKTLILVAHHDTKNEFPELAPLKAQFPAPNVTPETASAPADDSEYRFYTGHATHSRTGLSKPYSAFIGHLPMVRVVLPQTGSRSDVPPIQTPMGVLMPTDRLLASVQVVQEVAQRARIVPPERVELITPPRYEGNRFGAIAVYLLYPQAQAVTPSHYILEAGLATGQPRMRYKPTPVGQWLSQQSGYQPTAFSQPWHTYRGLFTMKNAFPNEPEALIVEAYERHPQSPYIRVTVEYGRDAAPTTLNPFFLTIQAAARISSIADALHMQVDLPMRPLLRFIGNFLHWVHPPEDGSGWQPPI
ncbi:MAG: hypothetical protein K8H88_20240 [Sandaracinaceae bacterium]|nr:hypothetical protein [Sandaracinaceae bacterium]